MQNQSGDRLSLLQSATTNVFKLSLHHCFYGACAGVLVALAVRRPGSSFAYIGLGMGIATGHTVQKGNEYILFKRRGGHLADQADYGDDELAKRID